MQVNDLAYFVDTTIPDYTRNRWVDLRLNIQRYLFARRFLGRSEAASNRLLFVPSGGTGFAWNYLYGTNNSAGFKGVGATIVPTTTTKVPQSIVPIRQAFANFQFTLQEAQAQAQSGTMIVNYINGKMYQATAALAKTLEDNLMTAPSSSANTDDPWGLLYWLTAGATAGALSQTNPPGWSTTAGLDRTSASLSQASNYYNTWSALTMNDVVYKIRDGLLSCEYESLDDMPTVDNLNENLFDIVVGNKANYLKIEDLARKQNNENTSDLAYRDGKVSVNGARMRWVTQFGQVTGQDTLQSILGVNWDTMRMIHYGSNGPDIPGSPRSLEGMIRTQKVGIQSQYDTLLYYMAADCNLVCLDARRNFRIDKA